VSEASVMGLVTACVFGMAAVAPYFVAALRLLRNGGARQPRRSPL
jgi:uncharacterized membrane protein (GlpM family)